MDKITLKLTTSEVARMTKTPLSTLYRWETSRPELYAILVRGCLAKMADDSAKVVGGK